MNPNNNNYTYIPTKEEYTFWKSGSKTFRGKLISVINGIISVENITEIK